MSFNPRRYVTILGSFYLLFFICFASFIHKPQSFYWRAWEYFEEIAYIIPHRNKWTGYEMGDEERLYGKEFHHAHFKWKTTASCMDEGYRMVPYKAFAYPIVVGGDSQVWGSGLSDKETIPWKMAEKLAIPVFNAARSPFCMEKVLGSSHLSQAKILIDIVTRGNLNAEHFEREVTLGKETLRSTYLGIHTNPKMVKHKI